MIAQAQKAVLALGSLLFALVGCSGDSNENTDPAGTGGTAQGGAAGTTQGGSGGTAQGGAAGTSQGGTAGAAGATGGTAGSATGGSAGSPINPVQPIPGVATNITLEIYSDGWGKLLETKQLDTEGPVVISVEEPQPYSTPPKYFIYARATGFYTELYNCEKGGTINVDLDAVPVVENAMTGVIFATQSFFTHCYYSGATLNLSGPNGLQGTLTTDSQGRYGLQGPLGAYKASFSYQGMNFDFDLTNTAATDYKDLSFKEPMQAAAPNLYLYPETQTDVVVTLGFPQGGQVVESAPPYGNGWQVSVSPEGMIEGGYSYLFYEASLPPKVQTSEGWLLEGSNLEGELRQLLTQIGFVGREIDDFVEYWVPLLEGSAWYAVYPQDAAKLVTLNISPTPQKVLRSLFLIRPLQNALSIQPPPAAAPFVREGFVAAEWGVLRGI